MATLIGLANSAVAPSHEQCVSEIERSLNDQGEICEATPSFTNELKTLSKSDCKRKVDTKLATLQKCKDKVEKIQSQQCGDYLDFLKQTFYSQYYFVKFAKYSCDEEKATRDIYDFPNGCITAFYRTCLLPMETIKLCE